MVWINYIVCFLIFEIVSKWKVNRNILEGNKYYLGCGRSYDKLWVYFIILIKILYIFYLFVRNLGIYV